MKPMGDQLLLKAVKKETKSTSGIILSADAETFGRAEVIATGDGVRTMTGDLIKMTLKKNDKVLYGKYSGTEVNINGEDLLIMKESDILATL